MVFRIHAFLVLLAAALWTPVASSDFQTQDADQWESCPLADQISQLSLSDDPVNSITMTKLIAYCLQKIGNYSLAIDYLKDSLTIQTDRKLDLYANQKLLAEILEIAGQLDEAENQWKSLLQSFDSNTDLDRDVRRELQYELGSYYQRQNRLTEAREFFSQSSKIQSKDDQLDMFYLNSLRSLIAILQDERKYAEATANAEKIIYATRYGLFLGIYTKEDMAFTIRELNHLL